MTFDTVGTDTPASAAISASVAPRPVPAGCPFASGFARPVVSAIARQSIESFGGVHDDFRGADPVGRGASTRCRHHLDAVARPSYGAQAKGIRIAPRKFRPGGV